MDRVIFKTEQDENVFIVPIPELNDFVLPNVGHRVTWQKTYMLVTAVEHEYDEKSYIVTVRVM